MQRARSVRVHASHATRQFSLAACKELFALLDGQESYGASAGTGRAHAHAAGLASRAHALGNPHHSDPAFQSQFDRNLLVYAMLDIKLSMDKDSLEKVAYSTLGLMDTICGSGVGGHRVPVDVADYETYDFQAGYEVEKFAPIVMFGSLESIRSTHMHDLASCPAGFAREDVSQHVYCNLKDKRSGFQTQRYLRLDAEQRALHAPFVMQRDRLCNASAAVSIEDVLGRPPHFDSALFDTPYRSKTALNTWVAPVWHRGEENLHQSLKSLSMMAWVYVTSSSDPRVRPGMHRLLDLPVFADAGCSQLPSVDCSGPGLAPFILNQGAAFQAEFENTVQYTRGRILMRTIRCSRVIEDFTGLSCEPAPYAANLPMCYQEKLLLASNPKLYSSKMWLHNLVAPPPLPPPLPPSPPPPSTPPPCPNPPPASPPTVSQREVMASIRTMEEEACTSVYYLTTTTRCNRLAVGLTRTVLYDRISPPSPPPGDPLTASPPPPRPPPSPATPSWLTLTPIASTRLSTYRVPIELGQSRLDLREDGYYTQDSWKEVKKALSGAPPDAALAKCTQWQSEAPLPCVSGALQDNCISGSRHCGSEYDNSDAPRIELQLSGAPATRGNRLWGFEIVLPETEELARLFFESVMPSIGGSGYKVDVFRADGSPIACAHAPFMTQIEAAALPGRVQHLCTDGGASDSELYALDQADRILITLSGSYRQIWFKSVTVFETSLHKATLPPRPPYPPPLPILPPNPPSLPAINCTFNANQYYEKRVVIGKEPCGVTPAQCCAAAHEQSAKGFELDDSRCCTLITDTDGDLTTDSSRWGWMTSRSGTGLLHS